MECFPNCINKLIILCITYLELKVRIWSNTYLFSIEKSKTIKLDIGSSGTPAIDHCHLHQGSDCIVEGGDQIIELSSSCRLSNAFVFIYLQQHAPVI
jgi:hypothetical protein